MCTGQAIIDTSFTPSSGVLLYLNMRHYYCGHVPVTAEFMYYLVLNVIKSGNYDNIMEHMAKIG